MIYLIESSGYSVDDKDIINYFRLLKIGYTKDIDSRIDSYYLHNPECKLLDTREGDTELESYFHSLYNKYNYPKRREWFYYSDDIINFFEDVDNINLESFPKSPISEKKRVRGYILLKRKGN